MEFKFALIRDKILRLTFVSRSTKIKAKPFCLKLKQ